MLRTFEVKRDVRKWRLEANTRRHIDIKDEFLQYLLHLIVR